MKREKKMNLDVWLDLEREVHSTWLYILIPVLTRKAV